MNEFEIHLLSSSSTDIFHNTLSEFTNLLKEPITLEGEWVVSLSEISYPTSIKNITTTEFNYYPAREDSSGMLHRQMPNEIKVTSGLYESIDSIVELLADA